MLGIALGLALHRAGWRVQAPPGMEVALVSDGGRQLRPFTAAGQPVSGEIGPDKWRAACDRLGITHLRVVATDAAERPKPKPAETDDGQAWYPLSPRCQLGWKDRNSVLLVSSRGLLKHRVGHRAAYAAGVWVRRDAIARAWLHKGISVDRMRLQLSGGSDVKLLIPTQEGRYPVLKEILSEWLGDRLTLT